MIVIPCHDQRKSIAERGTDLNFSRLQPNGTNTKEQTLMSRTHSLLLCFVPGSREQPEQFHFFNPVIF